MHTLAAASSPMLSAVHPPSALPAQLYCISTALLLYVKRFGQGPSASVNGNALHSDTNESTKRVKLRTMKPMDGCTMRKGTPEVGLLFSAEWDRKADVRCSMRRRSRSAGSCSKGSASTSSREEMLSLLGLARTGDEEGEVTVTKQETP